VLPSTSVKRNVTVPVGLATGRDIILDDEEALHPVKGSESRVGG
jgi:hypothetical protein